MMQGDGSEAAEVADLVEALVAEARLLLKRWGARWQRDGGESATCRARSELLLDLGRHGPQTVPQLARRRRVTRQHVQTLADALSREGQVAFAPNPSHRRSSLVMLTLRGEASLAELAITECRWRGRMLGRVGVGELTAALGVVRQVGQGLREGDESGHRSGGGIDRAPRLRGAEPGGAVHRRGHSRRFLEQEEDRAALETDGLPVSLL